MMSDRSPLFLKRFASTYAALFVPDPSAGGGQVTDSLGNVSTSAPKRKIMAYLKPTGSKGDLKQVGLAGAQGAQVYVTGFLVNPIKFPDGIKPPLSVPAEIGGERGILSILPKVPRPFGSETITGERIEGWFSTTSGHY